MPLPSNTPVRIDNDISEQAAAEQAISSESSVESVIFEDTPMEVPQELNSSLSKQSIRKKQQARHEAKMDGLCDPDVIEADIENGEGKHSDYCDTTCHQEITADQIYSIRVDIHREKYGRHRMEKIIENIRKSKTKQKKVHHFVEGIEVCKEYWISMVAKISSHTYRRAVTHMNKGIVKMVKVKKMKKKISREDAAKSYQHLYIMGNSDIDPSTTHKKLLGVGTTVTKIYNGYVEHESRSGIPPLSYRRFCQIWKDNFSHKVSFSTVGKIAVCDICVEYEHKTQRERDDIKRAELEREWSKHKEKQL